MNDEQLRSEAQYALCEMPPDLAKAKRLLDEHRKVGHEDAFNYLLLHSVQSRSISNWSAFSPMPLRMSLTCWSIFHSSSKARSLSFLIRLGLIFWIPFRRALRS